MSRNDNAKKHILEQYTDIRREEQDLIRRIQSLDAQILNIEMSALVVDTVSLGKRGKHVIGKARIEGIPVAKYNQRKSELRCLKKKLANKDAELLAKLNEVEDYIDQIDDSRIRQLIRYRFIDNMTFKEISKVMYESEESARKAIDRYLSTEK